MRSKPIIDPADPQAEARERAQALLDGEGDSSPGSAPLSDSGTRPKRRYRRRAVEPQSEAQRTAALAYIDQFLALTSRLFALPADEKPSAAPLPAGLRRPTADERIGAAAGMVAFTGRALVLKHALRFDEYREEIGFSLALSVWLGLLAAKHVPAGIATIGRRWRGEPEPRPPAPNRIAGLTGESPGNGTDEGGA